MSARLPLLGSPNCYAIEIETSLGTPLLHRLGQDLATLIEAVRATFEARIYAWTATPTRLRLVLQHLDQVGGDEAWLRQRWIAGGGIPSIRAEHLRDRLTSLAGFMQTLLQRISRQHNRQHGLRGSIWARRYRACLLADDDAVLAASIWYEHDQAELCFAGSQACAAAALPLRLTPPPIRLGPDGQWFHVEEGTPGLLPPPDEDRPLWLARIATEYGDDLPRYGHALTHGWALGRSESLTGALQRLGRSSGRGRTRRLHDLGDRFGLCGLWG